MPRTCNRMKHCIVAGAWIFAFELYWSKRLFEMDGMEMPMRVPLVSTLLNVLWLKMCHLQIADWTAFQDIQVELADEKVAQESLISMLCGCYLHLAIDGDTISRSTPLFDGLMEQQTKGSRLADHLPRGEDEHARIRDAFTRAMKGPVTLPVTLLSKSGLKHKVDIFIVRRGEVDSRGKRTSFGFLVGIRTEQCHPESLIQNTELPEASEALDCMTKEAGGFASGFVNDAASTSAETLSTGQFGGGIDSCPTNGKTQHDMYSSTHELLSGPSLRAHVSAKHTVNGQQLRAVSAPPTASRHQVISGDFAFMQQHSTGKDTDWSAWSSQVFLNERSMVRAPPGLHSEYMRWGPSVSVDRMKEGQSSVVVSGSAMQEEEEEEEGDEACPSSASEQSDSSVLSAASCSLAAATIVKVGSMTLRELLQLKAAGVGSVGSVHEANERCAPCSFHFTHIHAPSKRPPCKAGYLCEYCHDVSHNSYRCALRKCRRPYTLADGKVS